MLRTVRASLTTLSTLVLTTATLSAQSVIGVHVGANFASLGGADAGSNDTRTGIHVGASFTADLPGVFGVQVGAFFEQKGATDSSEGTNVALALDYIDVPVLLHLTLPSEGPVSAHALIGPAVGFQARCNAKGSGGGVNVSVSCSSLGVETKKVELGAMGGVGVNIKAPNDMIVMVDGLYNLGLTTIDNTGYSVKNRAFTIRAGVGIPLG